MKLSNTFKGALAGAVLMASQPGCGKDVNESCVAAANEHEAKIIYTEDAVKAHCANPANLVAETHQNILTCVTGYTEDGESIQMVDALCQDANLNQTLDAVFANEGAYCITTGAKAQCNPEG